MVSKLRDRKQRVVINISASEWAAVRSGMPQSSVSGLVLFTIYINDIDIGLNNLISRSADYTKIQNAVVTEQDRITLQDFYKLAQWSEIWKMPFNIEECQLLQIGIKNSKFNNIKSGRNIDSVKSVKDLSQVV